MENYDKLKQVIQAANPEIMELKFGCETDEGIVFTPAKINKVEIYIEGGGYIIVVSLKTVTTMPLFSIPSQ